MIRTLSLSLHRSAVASLLVVVCLTSLHAEDKPAEPQEYKHRVTGLFSPEREEDLREAMKAIPNVTLVSIDYKNAEATFSYDLKKAFNRDKPEQAIQLFDNQLRGATKGTFGIRPLCTIPRENLKFVEIPIVGLDCKGCCFAVYDMIYRMDGVEQATADFKAGLATAWIDPAKIDRAKLVEKLKTHNVQLKEP